ncbi:MAG: hypothetical protein PHY23_00275 [Oscillospiraceae bacterium]|nr:hypothetical protein [Oscillospiraceae bacterium]
MKKKKSLWSGVSLLIVAVLAIMAFFRNDRLQVWLLAASFIVWALWALLAFLLPALHEQKQEKLREERRRKREAEAKRINAFTVPDITDPVGPVLLRHVNFRVSAYLKSAYPDATWEWCEEEPEKIIARGGVGRIRLFGISDFNYADVLFDQQANINCSLMKVVPMAELHSESAALVTVPQPRSPVDPQVWYEVKGRKVLEELIVDLNSRGHSSLTIKDNGDVCIQQGDTEKPQTAVENLPEKVYWPRLAKVFEREGLAANVKDDGIILSW